MVRDTSVRGKQKAMEAAKYFVEKGGDLNIKDGDGVSARTMLVMASGRIAGFKPFAQEEDDGVPRCGKCNVKKYESGEDLLTCGRCKSMSYCSRAVKRWTGSSIRESAQNRSRVR